MNLPWLELGIAFLLGLLTGGIASRLPGRKSPRPTLARWNPPQAGNP